MQTLFAAALTAFFVLNVADLILTQKILNRGGREGNPLLAAIMGLAGLRWRVVKMGGAAFAIACLAQVGAGLLSGLVLGALLAAWAWVVWHNARVLRGMD